MDRARLAVIDNMERAVYEKDESREVEPVDTYALQKAKNKLADSYAFAGETVKKAMRPLAMLSLKRELRRFSELIETVDLQNALGLDCGCVVTSNHYSPFDSLPIRLLFERTDKAKRLFTAVSEQDYLIDGNIGFILRYADTVPLIKSSESLSEKFFRDAVSMLDRGGNLLMYPEISRWFNYRRPREAQLDAYLIAAEASVPILPTFTELRDISGFDSYGFGRYKMVLHVMPPIYPDLRLSSYENAAAMRDMDMRLKRECYRSVYGFDTDSEFIPERDVAGYRS